MAILLVGPLQDVLRSQRIPALVPHGHPRTPPFGAVPHPRPHDPISHAPFPRWAPLLAPVASSTAPAERSSDVQGYGRDAPGGRVQLNGYWKRLATVLDPLVAAPSGKRLHSYPGAAGVQQRALGDGDWPMSAPVPTCRQWLQRCTVPWPPFRTALAGGNAAIAAETRTRAATRMRIQSCDF
jgi:hypothetical protein